MSQMTLDVVYETAASRMERTGQNFRPGSLEISGGTVNVYFSNNDLDSPPANASEMTLDQNGPYGGIVEVVQAAKWILVELNTLTPVVKEFNVAIVPI